jgi:hypothetical protein
MDVWEHAFIHDYAAKDRPKYIEAFFSNLDWRAVESRIAKGKAARRCGMNKGNKTKGACSTTDRSNK